MLRGMVCGTCDNPYTMAALDDFRIEGDTLTFNILHEDWGDGEIPTFYKHVTAHVGWNEMRCTTAADHHAAAAPAAAGRRARDSRCRARFRSRPPPATPGPSGRRRTPRRRARRRRRQPANRRCSNTHARFFQASRVCARPRCPRAHPAEAVYSARHPVAAPWSGRDRRPGRRRTGFRRDGGRQCRRCAARPRRGAARMRVEGRSDRASRRSSPMDERCNDSCPGARRLRHASRRRPAAQER